MANRDVELLLRFPTVLPVESEAGMVIEYRGFLPVKGTDYSLRLQKTDGDRLSIELDPKPNNIPEEAVAEAVSGTDPVQALHNLTNLLSAGADPSRSRVDRKQTDLYRLVLTEYSELEEFYINIRSCTLSPDLRQIQIEHVDERSRSHSILVEADADGDPVNVFKVARHTLPDKNPGKELFERHNSLRSIYERFLCYIDGLQPYFDAMADIDASCWVLDPEEPDRKDRHRRIALGPHLSLIVTVDPWNVTTNVPDVKLLGPDRLTEAPRQKLAENLIGWDVEGGIVHELLKLLGMDGFPTRPTPAHAEQQGPTVLYDTDECCVCFSSRLNEKLPEIVCPNASCERNFHKECLYQWLTAVGAKQSFNELHGQCPHCEKNISCPL